MSERRCYFCGVPLVRDDTYEVLKCPKPGCTYRMTEYELALQEIPVDKPPDPAQG